MTPITNTTGKCSEATLTGETSMTDKEFADAVQRQNYKHIADKRVMRVALQNMLKHMFGPNDTGMTRPEIEEQARAAINL